MLSLMRKIWDMSDAVGDGGDELVRFGDVGDVAVCGKIACWNNPKG